MKLLTAAFLSSARDQRRNTALVGVIGPDYYRDIGCCCTKGEDYVWSLSVLTLARTLMLRRTGSLDHMREAPRMEERTNHGLLKTPCSMIMLFLP